MDVLRAANKTDAGHAEAVGIERLFRGGDERGMIGQAEVIVRAHVEDAAAAGDFDFRVLRTRDDALGFVKPLRSDFRERVSELLIEFLQHAARISRSSTNRQS